MTQEERIIKKVYDAKKVELGTHKVDLALINDIADAKKQFEIKTNSIESIGQDLAKKLSIASNAKQALEREVSSLISYSSEVKSLLIKYQASAKELGLNVTDLPDYKLLEKNILDGKKYLDFYKKIGEIPNI